MDTRPPARGTSLWSMCAPDDTRLAVADTRFLQVYMVLRIGREMLLLRHIDDVEGAIDVDRGYGGTRATSHDPGSPIDIIGVAMPEDEQVPPMIDWAWLRAGA